MSAMTRRNYSTNDVAGIAQVSLRQLQWLDEQAIVSPRHHGHRRVYLAEQVIEIATVAELRRKGLSLQKVRKIVRFLQRELPLYRDDVMRHDRDLYLVTDGERSRIDHKPGRVINVLKESRLPMFLVCITDQAQRVVGYSPS